MMLQLENIYMYICAHAHLMKIKKKGELDALIINKCIINKLVLSLSTSG